MPAFDFEIVYLARHGETEWNREGRRQGRLDSPLTQKGWDQAQRLARFVTTLSPTPDGLSSSPLGRAIATAEVCSKEIGLPVVVVDDLAELDHGRITGMTSSDVDEAFPGELERREEDKYAWRFPGGERTRESPRPGASRTTSSSKSTSLVARSWSAPSEPRRPNA